MLKSVLPNTILKKCPSEHAAMCPSKHELCVLPNMKLELRNMGSPLQLALKPTHTRRANIMGPKAPNMRVSQILEQDRSTQNAPQFNLANLPEHLGYVVKNHYWVSIVRPSAQSAAAECSMSR